MGRGFLSGLLSGGFCAAIVAALLSLFAPLPPVEVQAVVTEEAGAAAERELREAEEEETGEVVDETSETGALTTETPDPDVVPPQNDAEAEGTAEVQPETTESESAETQADETQAAEAELIDSTADTDVVAVIEVEPQPVQPDDTTPRGEDVAQSSNGETQTPAQSVLSAGNSTQTPDLAAPQVEPALPSVADQAPEPEAELPQAQTESPDTEQPNAPIASVDVGSSSDTLSSPDRAAPDTPEATTTDAPGDTVATARLPQVGDDLADATPDIAESVSDDARAPTEPDAADVTANRLPSIGDTPDADAASSPQPAAPAAAEEPPALLAFATPVRGADRIAENRGYSDCGGNGLRRCIVSRHSDYARAVDQPGCR